MADFHETSSDDEIQVVQIGEVADTGTSLAAFGLSWVNWMRHSLQGTIGRPPNPNLEGGWLGVCSRIQLDWAMNHDQHRGVIPHADMRLDTAILARVSKDSPDIVELVQPPESTTDWTGIKGYRDTEMRQPWSEVGVRRIHSYNRGVVTIPSLGGKTKAARG